MTCPVIMYTLRRTSSVQRLFLLVLAGNVLLTLLGLHVVPATLSSTLYTFGARNTA
jgi:hypothetical protein